MIVWLCVGLLVGVFNSCLNRRFIDADGCLNSCLFWFLNKKRKNEIKKKNKLKKQDLFLVVSHKLCNAYN